MTTEAQANLIASKRSQITNAIGSRDSRMTDEGATRSNTILAANLRKLSGFEATTKAHPTWAMQQFGAWAARNELDGATLREDVDGYFAKFLNDFASDLDADLDALTTAEASALIDRLN